MIIQLILPILPIILSGIDRRDVIEEGRRRIRKQAFNFDKYTPLYMFNIVNSEKLKQISGKFKFSNESNIEYPKTRTFNIQVEIIQH